MQRWTRTYDPTTGAFPPAIKALLIANAAVFVVQVLAGPIIMYWFGLHPATVVARGWVWQPLTYMFLHGGVFHLLFNMFALWMFGAEIERAWGRAEFLKYYVVCGLGGAALSFFFNYGSVVIGASGAVYGILLAFGMLFPDRYIYLWFFLPIKAKYLVMGLAAIAFLAGISSGPEDGIGHAAHLGGFVAGFIYLRWGRGGSPVDRLVSRWRKRRLKVIEGGAGGGARDVEAEIDRILDKISQSGLESLTPEEERILDDASRRDRRE